MSAKNNLSLAGVAFVVGLVAAFLFLREPMEPLTEQALQSAKQRWHQADVQSYDVGYRMHGSVYAVQVRDGIVTRVTVDGKPSLGADPRNYSVEGLFATLSLELENRNDPSSPFAGRAESLVMRVRFHPQLGYVERYLRSGGNMGRGAAIELIDFTAVGD